VYVPEYRTTYNFVSYVHFDMDEPVTIEVTYKNPIDSGKTWLSPLGDKIPYVIDGNRLTFTLDSPKKLILGINSPNGRSQDLENEGILAIIAMPSEENVPHIGDPGVIDVRDYVTPQEALDACPTGGTVYFPAGVYQGQYLVRRDDSTVYLAGGAIIRSPKTPLVMNGRNNITLKGRGSLQTDYPSTQPVLGPTHTDHLTVEGIVLRMGGTRLRKNGVKTRGAGFAFFPHYCNHLSIANIAVLRYPHGADGVDPDNCQHVEIRDSLIISGDDSIVIKTETAPYLPRKHFRILNNIVYTRSASGFKLGTTGYTDSEGILVDRLHVVHSGQIKLCNQGSGSAIAGLRLRNVTLEYAERSILQISAVDNWVTSGPYRGDIDVTLENLTVHRTGKVDNADNFPGLYLYATEGYDCKITFINLVVEGKRIMSLQDLADTGNFPRDKARIENVEVVFK
jgi:hypothetical protein